MIYKVIGIERGGEGSKKERERESEREIRLDLFLVT